MLLDNVHETLIKHGGLAIINIAQCVYNDRYPSVGKVRAVKRALVQLGATSVNKGAIKYWTLPEFKDSLERML